MSCYSYAPAKGLFWVLLCLLICLTHFLRGKSKVLTRKSHNAHLARNSLGPSMFFLRLWVVVSAIRCWHLVSHVLGQGGHSGLEQQSVLLVQHDVPDDNIRAVSEGLFSYKAYARGFDVTFTSGMEGKHPSSLQRAHTKHFSANELRTLCVLSASSFIGESRNTTHCTRR